MQTQHTPIFMISPSPLVRLRIARRRLVIAWTESEHLQPFTVALVIFLVLLAPIVFVFVEVW